MSRMDGRRRRDLGARVIGRYRSKAGHGNTTALGETNSRRCRKSEERGKEGVLMVEIRAESFEKV
jgi:hypothetical protein